VSSVVRRCFSPPQNPLRPASLLGENHSFHDERPTPSHVPSRFDFRFNPPPLRRRRPDRSTVGRSPLGTLEIATPEPLGRSARCDPPRPRFARFGLDKAFFRYQARRVGDDSGFRSVPSVTPDQVLRFCGRLGGCRCAVRVTSALVFASGTQRHRRRRAIESSARGYTGGWRGGCSRTPADDACLAELGTTRRGSRVRINRRAPTPTGDPDGAVVLHYSGLRRGRKSILPGVAAADTMPTITR
jgi:hypothetical protein